MVAYPPSLTARIYNDYTFEFGRRRGIAPLNAQSVLYSVIYLHERLPTSSLTRNLLLPISIGLSPLYPARPSDLQISNGAILHQLSSGFNLARHRSTGFRSSTIDSKRAHFALTVNCQGLVGFPSATRINRLTSPMIKLLGHFSKRTTRRRHIIAFTPCQPVPNWFHVLFTSRQGYFSAFTHVTCKLSVSNLGLEVCLPYSRDFQRTLLSYSHVVISGMVTGFHPFGCAVPGNFSFTDLDKRLQTTSPSLSSRDSACPIPFSFATTHGISVDFISSPTKMLQFGVPYRIAIVSEETGSPIQPSADPRHSCVSPRLSCLVTTFIGTRAERSPSWVVASHVCIPHHASNPSVSKHANSASTENHLPEG